MGVSNLHRFVGAKHMPRDALAGGKADFDKMIIHALGYHRREFVTGQIVQEQ